MPMTGRRRHRGAGPVIGDFVQPKRGAGRIVSGSGICRGGSAMRALVRLLGMMAVLAVFAAVPVGAQTSDADQAAIRQVIQSQIAAFQKDDGPTAYGYASPTIQQKFINPEVFMEMV